MDSNNKVVYYGTVDRGVLEGTSHIELVRFKEPVVVKEIRVLSCSTAIIIDNSQFLGSSWPDSFRLEIFVNNFREPPSAFTLLGSLDYRARVSDQFLVESDILTDALAIRGAYSRLSVVVLGQTVASQNGSVQLNDKDITLFRESPFFDIERRLLDRDREREVPPTGDSRVTFSLPATNSHYSGPVSSRPPPLGFANAFSNDRNGEIFEEDMSSSPALRFLPPNAAGKARSGEERELEDADLVGEAEDDEQPVRRLAAPRSAAPPTGGYGLHMTIPQLITDEERTLEIGEADEPDELLSIDQIIERLGEASFYECFSPLRAFQSGVPTPLDAAAYQLERTRDNDLDSEADYAADCHTSYDLLAELAQSRDSPVDAALVERIERVCGKFYEAMAHALAASSESVPDLCHCLYEMASRCLSVSFDTVDNTYAVRSLRCGLQLSIQLAQVSKSKSVAWRLTGEQRNRLQKTLLLLLALNESSRCFILPSTLVNHLLLALRATFDYQSVAESCSSQNPAEPTVYSELLRILQRSVEQDFLRVNSKLERSIERTLDRVHLPELLLESSRLIDDAVAAQTSSDADVDTHLAAAYGRLNELFTSLLNRLIGDRDEEEDLIDVLADLDASSFVERVRTVLCRFEYDDAECRETPSAVCTAATIASDSSIDADTRRRFTYLDLLCTARRLLVALSASRPGALLLFDHCETLNGFMADLRSLLANESCSEPAVCEDSEAEVDLLDVIRRLRIETLFAVWSQLATLRCVDDLFVSLRDRKTVLATELDAIDASISEGTLARLDCVFRSRLAQSAARVLADGVHLAAPIALVEPFTSAKRPLRATLKPLERNTVQFDQRVSQLERELGKLRAAESKQQRDASATAGDAAKSADSAVRGERERAEKELEAAKTQATAQSNQLNNVRSALGTVQQAAVRSKAFGAATKALVAAARHVERTGHLRVFFPRLAFVTETPVSKRLVELADWLAALRSCPLLAPPSASVSTPEAIVRWCVDRLKRAYDDLPDAPKSVIVALRVLHETLFESDANEEHSGRPHVTLESAATRARRSLVLVQLLQQDVVSVLVLIVGKMSDVAFRRRAALSQAAPHGPAYVQLRSRLSAIRAIVLHSIRILYGVLKHSETRTVRAHRGLVATLVSVYATFCLPAASAGDDWHVTLSARDFFLNRVAAESELDSLPLASTRHVVPAETRRLRWFLLRSFALFVRIEEEENQTRLVKSESETNEAELPEAAAAVEEEADEFDVLLSALLGETNDTDASRLPWLPRTYLASLYVLGDLLPSDDSSGVRRVRAVWAKRLISRREALKVTFERASCLFAHADGSAQFRRLVYRLASTSPSVALLLVDIAVDSANEALRAVFDESDETLKTSDELRWTNLAGRLETLYNVLLQPAARHACLELATVSSDASRQIETLLGLVARLLDLDAACDALLNVQVLFAQLHTLSALYVLFDASLEHTESILPFVGSAGSAEERRWLDWFVSRFLRGSLLVEALLAHVVNEENDFVTVAAGVNLLKSLHRASPTGARLVREALQRELAERADGDDSSAKRTLFALFARLNNTFSKENVACLHALSNALEFLHVLRVGWSPSEADASRLCGLSVSEICALLQWNCNLPAGSSHPIYELHTLLREYAAEEPILGDLLHSLASLLELLNRCAASAAASASAASRVTASDQTPDVELPPPASYLRVVFERLFESAGKQHGSFALQSRSFRIARSFEVDRRIGMRNALDDELVECASDAYRTAFRERRLGELAFFDEVLANVDDELAADNEPTQFAYRNVARSAVQRDYAVVNFTRFEKVGAAPWRGRPNRNVVMATQGGAPTRLARVPNSSRAASIHVDEYVIDGVSGGVEDDDAGAGASTRVGVTQPASALALAPTTRGGPPQRGAYRTARGGVQLGPRIPPPAGNVAPQVPMATPTDPPFGAPLAEAPPNFGNVSMFEGAPLLSGVPQPNPNMAMPGFRVGPPGAFVGAGSQPPFAGGGGFAPNSVDVPYGYGGNSMPFVGAGGVPPGFYSRGPTLGNSVGRFGGMMPPDMAASGNAMMMQPQQQQPGPGGAFALSGPAGGAFVEQPNAPYGNNFGGGNFQPVPMQFAGGPPNQQMRGGPAGRHTSSMPHRQLRSLIE